MKLGTAHIIQADARTLPLADTSVDLIVTSPPYFALRSYQDGGQHYAGQIGSEPTPAEFVAALLEVTRECVRVLKPSGSLWVNLGDKYSTGSSGDSGMAELSQKYRGGGHTQAKAKQRTSRVAGMRPKSLIGIPWRYALACIDDLGLILRAEVIWSKPNGLPESVTDRVRRSHEQWFHFTLEPRYFAAVDEIREAHSDNSHARRADGAPTPKQTAGLGADVRRGYLAETYTNPLGKLPGSVWTVATEPLKVPADLGIDHFAAFPTEWPKRLIQGWSPAGVCTVCGEGRRPVTDKVLKVDHVQNRTRGFTGTAGASPLGSHGAGEGKVNGFHETTITGYVCACNEPIATPTGSRAGVDPSAETGRAGFNRPRAGDEGTRVITRWEQRHEAEQLRDSEHRAAMAAEAGDTAFAHYLRTDRSGARPIPEPLRQAWRDRGWLQPAPEYVPAPTTPAVVLDPFGGTGTTAMVAKALGRTGISVDMSADYCRLATWRTNDRDQLAKVLGVAKAEQQDAGQLDMLTLLEDGEPA